MKYFLKDTIFTGIIAGVLVQLLTLLLILSVNYLLVQLSVVDEYISTKNLIPLSMLPNLHVMRNYFLKYKLEKSGAGVLLLTFVVMAVFFILHLQFHLF
jgi:hypothetical protein